MIIACKTIDERVRLTAFLQIKGTAPLTVVTPEGEKEVILKLSQASEVTATISATKLRPRNKRNHLPALVSNRKWWE